MKLNWKGSRNILWGLEFKIYWLFLRIGVWHKISYNQDRISNHLNEDKQGPKLSPFMTRESKGTALKC